MTFKKWLPVVASVVIFAGLALASSIKVWTSGDIITAADLNGNFAHIHNTMVGGHGARLVDADVSTSAAIAHSKMATPALLPKAWASVGTTNITTACSASPCSFLVGSGVTSVTRTSAGLYVVNLTTTRANGNYAVIVSISTPTANYICTGAPTTTSTATVNCSLSDGVHSATDAAFSVLIMDDNN